MLGTYDIDEYGDTTLPDYGGFRVQNGEVVFDRVIKAAQQSTARRHPGYSAKNSERRRR